MAQMTVQQLLELGQQRQQAGDLPEAESIFRHILGAVPDHPDALHLLGTVMLQGGRLEEAAQHIGRAIHSYPSAGHYHCNLGHALAGLERTDEAIEAFQRALSLQPNSADALSGLGNAMQTAKRFDEALELNRRAVALRPQSPEMQYNLANALRNLGQFDEAAAAYRKALSIRPDFAVAYNNLGSALLAAGRADEAIEAFGASAGLHDKAKTDPPGQALAHTNLGMGYLLKRDFARGWPEHEWRWGTSELARYRRNFTQPMWDGRELNGKTILLHPEQGLGDTIQFSRFAKLVKQRGGRVILQVPSSLLRLMQSLAGADELIGEVQPLPSFDVRCPLLSLPMVLKTTLETIPAEVPYLRAEPSLSSRWRERLSSGRRRIGLAWAGRPEHVQDRYRSLFLSTLAPLFDVPGISFVSLQKDGQTTVVDDTGVPPVRATPSTNGTSVSQTTSSMTSSPLNDWTDELRDFADTAALIDNLDLVISVDTSVAHLAGAMEKPVWVLIPFAPDWRWMRDRTDSPWYPTLRLFRQPSPGDWQTPIQQIAQELRHG